MIHQKQRISCIADRSGARPACAALAVSLITAAATTLSTTEAQAFTCSFGGAEGTACITGTPYDSTPTSDKTITLIKLPSGGSGTLELDYIDLGAIGLSPDDAWDFDVNFSPALSAPGAYTLDYLISITDPTRFFSQVQLGGNSITGLNTVQKQVFSDSAFTNELSSLLISGTQNTGFINLPANQFQNLWIRDTYTIVDEGVMDNFENGFRQNTVPAPLPLLGAGAAFGFSRKLRRRINASRPLIKG